MKCAACGYDGDKDDWWLVQSSFLNVYIPNNMEEDDVTSRGHAYACPKCLTLKLKVEEE